MMEDDVKETSSGVFAHYVGWILAFIAPPWCMLTTGFQWVWANFRSESEFEVEGVLLENPTWSEAFFAPGALVISGAYALIAVLVPSILVVIAVAVMRGFGGLGKRWSDRRATQKYVDVVGGRVEFNEDVWSAMDDAK